MSKTALITGATSGIGAAYGKRLASEGYNLILTGRRPEIIQTLADDLTKHFNIRVEVIIAELTDDFDIQKVVNAIKSTENLEILINNAGYMEPYLLFTEKDPLESEQMMKVLVTVPMRLIYAAIHEMNKNGRGVIINVASQAAFLPNKKSAVYAACKAFLKSFSESLHLEVKNKGIKVQVVCPGPTDTNIWRSLPEVKVHMSQYKLMSPETLVDYSLKDLKKNHVVCITGIHDKLFQARVKFLPRSWVYRMVDKSVA